MITTWESVKRFPGVPKLRRSSPYIFMHFLPGISLLTLRRFVAEVRWLFPESRQKQRESGKQRNTEPWRWELNENTTQRFLKSVLHAHHFIAYIWSKSSAVPVYCLFVFACFFFLLWQYLCIFLFSVYKPTSEYWHRVKRWTFQKSMREHKLLKKQQSFIHAITTLHF